MFRWEGRLQPVAVRGATAEVVGDEEKEEEQRRWAQKLCEGRGESGSGA